MISGVVNIGCTCHIINGLGYGNHNFTYRGYTEKKVQENVQCEIFQTLLEEARESYKTEIVHELQSNTPEQMEENLNNIMAWLEQWKMEH